MGLILFIVYRAPYKRQQPSQTHRCNLLSQVRNPPPSHKRQRSGKGPLHPLGLPCCQTCGESKAGCAISSEPEVKPPLLSLLDDNTASLVIQIMLGRSKFTLELTDLQAKISVKSSDTTSLKQNEFFSARTFRTWLEKSNVITSVLVILHTSSIVCAALTFSFQKTEFH